MRVLTLRSVSLNCQLLTVNCQPMIKNQRRCVACRQLAGKESFWRFVRLYPSHQVQLDQGMGRSAYLCPNPDCLKVAQKKNRLGHALRASVPEELYQILWQRLTTPSELSE
ncbi:MAG: YlxR family protein [Planktothrix sp.]|uniref:YlxR family protein n=2 Tax=Planktothrix sp. TaxID=3088171 RepID=UPI0038D4BD9B